MSHPQPESPGGRDWFQHALLTAADEIDLAKRIEAGLYAQHLLTSVPEDQWPAGAGWDELTYLAEDGVLAKAQFLSANMRLVKHIAKPFRSPTVDAEDTGQDGILGLIRAVEKFDHAKGFKFSTYATWWIKQAIQTGASQSTQVHVAKDVEGKMRKLAAVTRRLEDTHGRTATLAELAEATGYDEHTIINLRRFDHKVVSLDGLLTSEDGFSLGDVIGDEAADAALAAVEAAFDQKAHAAYLAEILRRLPPRQAQVLRLRFGLAGERPMTLVEVADRLKVSRETIRNAELQAIYRIKITLQRSGELCSSPLAVND